MSALAEPEILRCDFDDGFSPPLAAMVLRWPGTVGPAQERTWVLPASVRLVSPPPQRFGFAVLRYAADAYSVNLLWDRTCLSWISLKRWELLDSDLRPLLRAMGTQLDYLLDQPALSQGPGRLRAA